jgi:F0F1-type ATP synthase assembly protein I
MVGVGWYVGLCIFLGVWGGLWFDKKFNTEPFLVIVGLIAGLALAVYGIYRMVLPLMNDRQDKEND